MVSNVCVRSDFFGNSGLGPYIFDICNFFVHFIEFKQWAASNSLKKSLGAHTKVVYHILS